MELVDALREAPPLSLATVRSAADELRILEASNSRFFFEVEDAGAVVPRTHAVRVEAPGYVPVDLSASIPASVLPEIVELLPGPGYAFSPTLPRVQGRVVLGSPEGEHVAGALIRFTTIEGSLTAGRTSTRSVADGLYAMWLRHDAGRRDVASRRIRIDASWSRAGTSYTGSVLLSAPQNAIVHGAPLLVIS